MYALVDKVGKRVYVCKDISFISGVVGVHRSTMSRRMPYWEDSNYIACEVEVKKSNRGTNNLPDAKR